MGRISIQFYNLIFKKRNKKYRQNRRKGPKKLIVEGRSLNVSTVRGKSGLTLPFKVQEQSDQIEQLPRCCL